MVTLLRRQQPHKKASKTSDAPLDAKFGWGEWVTVESSNIQAVRFNYTSSALEVKFRSGSLYRYVSVPENVYVAMLNSRSKGRFLNHSVKKRYPAYKV